MDQPSRLDLKVLERKLSNFVKVTPAELCALRSNFDRVLRLGAGEDVLCQGIAEHNVFIILSGWVASFKILPDGMRQVIDFHIPGDFLGLRTILLRTADYSFAPVSDVTVTQIGMEGLLEAFRVSPRLALAVLWSASRDEAMMVEHLVNVGRRDALTRTAHCLLELGARLKLVGLGDDAGYDCPLTQYYLADALGLSAIHLNRCLRCLREMKLLTLKDGKVTFHDLPGLVELAMFETDYLDQVGALI